MAKFRARWSLDSTKLGVYTFSMPLAAIILLLAAQASAQTRGTDGCFEGMAPVEGFCIDKWEAVAVDLNTSEEASPYFVLRGGKDYPGARWQEAVWKAKPKADYPLPPLPASQNSTAFKPKAVTKPGVYPQGFSTKQTAAAACQNAGKRLCTRQEWYKACIGPDQSAAEGKFPVLFPYGSSYSKDKCNFNVVNAHPLLVVGRSSSELDDPRLMLAKKDGRRLLAKTGDFADCTNGYGVFDMVGNQDEIVDDPPGGNMLFVGSFYSRDQTKTGPQGCASMIGGHVEGYFDYSLGFRCCSERVARAQ